MTAEARFVFLAIQVRDLARAERFYRGVVGLPLEPVQSYPEGDRWLRGRYVGYTWREGAYVRFALFDWGHEDASSKAQIGFFVDDLDVAHTRALAAGAEVLHSPRPEPWGRTARYADPDGNIVGLTERRR